MEIKPTSHSFNVIVNNDSKKNRTVSSSVEPKNCELSDNCLCNIGKAQILLQNKLNRTPETNEDIKKLLEQIFAEKGIKVGYCRGDKYISLGRPFEHFPNLCKDEMRAVCKRDEDGFLSEIFVFENGGINNRGIVYVFSADGQLKKYFDIKDMEALHEYKYSPECFHETLRKGKFRGLQKPDEIQSWIKILDNLFIDDTKSFKIDTPTVVYRALPDKLSEEQIEQLSKIGGVFKENSYSSTTQNLNIAKRFHRYNPILEIEMPKDSKYIDMDSLFNIDRNHWNEKEFLLPRGAKFEVVGFDEKNDIIKVKYLID